MTTALIRVDEEPLRKNLTQEIESVARDLNAIESQIETYFFRDLPQYQAWVAQKYSHRMDEIAVLEKIVAEMGAKVENAIQLSLETEVDPAEIFRKMDHCDDSSPYSDAGHAAITPACVQKAKADSMSKALYRQIIRQIHPDVRGKNLEGLEKTLWMKAQRAYTQNDSFELQRIYHSLNCGLTGPDEVLSISDLMQQRQSFKMRYERMLLERDQLRRENAWSFSSHKNVQRLSQELEIEYDATVRRLKQKQGHVFKTIKSWEATPGQDIVLAKVLKKRRKPGPQSSLFD